MIRVGMLEADIVTLKYLEALFNGSQGMEVTGLYDSGTEALKLVPHNVPDVLISALNLPDIRGIDVIRTLRAQFIDMEILVHSTCSDREVFLSTIKAGAGGYIVKGINPAEIIDAVRVLGRGGSPISHSMTRHLVDEIRGAAVDTNHSLLSSREKDVLGRMARGLSKKQIAEELSLSPHTVHAYTKSIYKKLGSKSMTEAIFNAREKGVIQD